jgi:predicted transcriptional regulator
VNLLLDQLRRLLETFANRVEDRSTLDELHRIIGEPESWSEAHDLFSRIRKKTLVAVERKDTRATYQYSFEELCAKTIYNLTDTDAPFDSDSPYWVVPHALKLARELGIDESDITSIVTV